MAAPRAREAAQPPSHGGSPQAPRGSPQGPGGSPQGPGGSPQGPGGQPTGPGGQPTGPCALIRCARRRRLRRGAAPPSPALPPESPATAGASSMPLRLVIARGAARGAQPPEPSPPGCPAPHRGAARRRRGCVTRTHGQAGPCKLRGIPGRPNATGRIRPQRAAAGRIRPQRAAAGRSGPRASPVSLPVPQAHPPPPPPPAALTWRRQGPRAARRGAQGRPGSEGGQQPTAAGLRYNGRAGLRHARAVSFPAKPAAVRGTLGRPAAAVRGLCGPTAAQGGGAGPQSDGDPPLDRRVR